MKTSLEIKENKNFLWGAATAAYQLEGAAFEDSKGLSIWDTFSHRNGTVANNHNGDTACDHYHHLEEDLNLMQELGLKSYRFSVSWPRILPNGTGAVNETGISFYNRLIDGLLARNIEPCMTLFHWDLPYSLHRRGGWLNDDSPLWFEEYAGIISRKFGDRIKLFITLNEPQCIAGGYYNGELAPGYHLSKGELLQTCHNLLKAHGRAVSVLKQDNSCRVGIAHATAPFLPDTDATEDVEGARSGFVNSDYDAFMYSPTFWTDPIVFGRYPEWVNKYKALDAPVITAEELSLINQPIDFIGLNIYTGTRYSASKGLLVSPPGSPHTLIGWDIVPQALYWGSRFIYERYDLPIMITENGMSCHDAVSLDGKVHDSNRIDYLERCLKELSRASADGVDIRGYYLWSLIDNFEWAKGYQERFGIIYCDYATQKRTLKDSAIWYKKLIETNGAAL